MAPRDQFGTRVPGHEEILRHRGRHVFQRLDDVEALFTEHVGTPISAQVPQAVWSRLQVVFQQRHVLVHRQGIVDEQYVQRVPHARQQAGQRLVVIITSGGSARRAPRSPGRSIAAAVPSPSPTAAPGTLLLTCNDANLGRLESNWRAGSFKAGPLWFVSGRHDGYVHDAASDCQRSALTTASRAA